MSRDNAEYTLSSAIGRSAGLKEAFELDLDRALRLEESIEDLPRVLSRGEGTFR